MFYRLSAFLALFVFYFISMPALSEEREYVCSNICQTVKKIEISIMYMGNDEGFNSLIPVVSSIEKQFKKNVVPLKGYSGTKLVVSLKRGFENSERDALETYEVKPDEMKMKILIDGSRYEKEVTVQKVFVSTHSAFWYRGYCARNDFSCYKEDIVSTYEVYFELPFKRLINPKPL